MNRWLILLGAILVLTGVAWPWLSKLPLGRLPGDIFIDRSGFKVWLPITSMVLVSTVLSLVLWLWRRW
ncbi:MAG: DUF2905 domain-containing protein [Pseudomonadota bacterium]|nr:DUF2905 domain-containing protein [Pseudomonadota bacterium]